MNYDIVIDYTLRPFIVPPTWNKTTHGEYLQPVWQSALKELTQATRLIIIGYSLPQTDSFFKYLLALGLSENESLQEIILIDPAKEDAKEALEKRYRDFIAPYFDIQGFTFWNVSFSAGVEALNLKRDNLRMSNQEIIDIYQNRKKRQGIYR